MSDPTGRYGRALTHLQVQARRRAGTVVDGPAGLFAVFDERWPASHLSNRVLVTADLPGPNGADDVVVFTDQVFTGRGLGHRKVDVLDGGTAARVTPALQALGFGHDEILVMTAQPVPLPRDDPAEEVVRVVGEDVVRPLVERGWEIEAPTYDPDVVRQLVERRDALDLAGAVTRLAVLGPVTGQAVAKADLLVIDGVAEIDDVLCLPEHRGQGYASALVRNALAQAVGCDLVYLEAAAADWPQHLYARLGFETVGSVHEHTLVDAEPAVP